MFNIYSLQKRVNWRKRIIALLGMFLIGIPGCVSSNTKIYRVGILCGSDALVSTIAGFLAKMDELGYHSGQNIQYDIQKTNGDPDGEKLILERFVEEKVDLIFAFPHDAALNAKNIAQGSDVPIVFAYANLEDSDLVRSIREPGGNITGIQHPLDQLTVKRFELLLEFDPSIQRIWVAYKKDTESPTALMALSAVSQSKGVTLVEVSVSDMDDIRTDFETREKMADIGIDAIFIMPVQLIDSKESWSLIRDFALRHKLPLSANVSTQIRDGALFHYGNDYTEVGFKAAFLADKILQGTPPSELPVISPEGYLHINMANAQAIGLTVPEGLLKQAVEIIR